MPAFANRSAYGCTSPQPGALTPQHTMGEVVCAWFGKIPVVKEKMAKPSCINCVTFCFREGNDGLTSKYGQRLPAEYAGSFRTLLMGLSLLDLGQFNDWNEKIEWLSMQKYVTINWWEGDDGLEVPYTWCVMAGCTGAINTPWARYSVL